MKNLYISATGSKSGKSAIALGMMSLLRTKLAKVGYFRPIIAQSELDSKDHDIELMRTHYKLETSYEESYACTFLEARELLNSGQSDVLMEKILRKYNELAEKCDFVLCQGTDFSGKEMAFEFALNIDIAANLGASILLVASSGNLSAEELASSFHANIEICNDKGVDILACIFNMATLTYDEEAKLLALAKSEEDENSTLCYVIPANETLAMPSIRDVSNWIDAKILYGEKYLDTLVSEYRIAAMQSDNFLKYIDEGNLVVTPGDRSDIILAGLVSRMSNSYPPISGILLTGDLEIPSTIKSLIDGWTEVPVPIISTGHHTSKTLSILTGLHGRIQPDDERKINLALALFEQHVDTANLSDLVIKRKSEKQTPMMFEYQLVEQARKKKMRIVLPEGSEERILRASEVLLQRNVADIILLGNVAEIENKAKLFGLDISQATIIDPLASSYFTDFTETYYELRKNKKGMNMDVAKDRMSDATYFGTMMVHKNLADGMVSGAINTTAHTVRPALEFIKTKPAFSIVSSIFFMCLKDRVLAFGDCAINPAPNAEQLAEIAISAAETAEVFGLSPRVAMLSYSTGTSGTGADVEKVKEATAIVREKQPDLLIEGPIQYDAAIDPEVAKTKLPDSEVAGHATVFIFPDLNTGNNTYKAVQRAADAVAIGPVLQGLNKPVNDLSRGCTVADIVNTVAITAIQAQSQN